MLEDKKYMKRATSEYIDEDAKKKEDSRKKVVEEDANCYYLNGKYKVNKTDILSAHFPLIHNANKRNGSMSALSKSHLEGNYSTINITGKKNGFKSFTPKNIKKIEKKFEEVQFKLNIGDVLFFTKNLIHKSNFNYSEKCRFIGIIRFIR